MKVDFQRIKEEKQGVWIAIDSFMLVLIVANLTWMIFDFSFTAHFFQNIIHQISPAFFKFYNETVHPDFLLYDFAFVCVFLTEFVIRWIASIVKKEFPSWVSYPFVYWYDLLGCIPIASFRFLRLFRIITLVVRLQKKGAIDVTDTWWYNVINRNYQIVIEEISDRVTNNILSGVQKEIQYNDETNLRILREVIVPRKDDFVKWIASKLSDTVNSTYDHYREDLRIYIKEAVDDAVDKNPEIAKLERIPIVGKQVSESLASSIADISFGVIEKMMKDLASERAYDFVEKSVDVSLKAALTSSPDEEVREISKEIVHETLEVMKKQVNKKHYDR